MALSDTDLELLESYLDDALEISEVEALQLRLAHDEELAAAMADLRARRNLCKSIFASFEPDTKTTRTVISGILSATVARDRTIARRAAPAWRYAAVAAACIAIGFVGRGAYDRAPSSTSNLVRHNSGVDLQKVASFQVTLRDDAGNVVAVQRFDSLEKANEFAADLARWQSRSERLASGRFVLSADRF